MTHARTHAHTHAHGANYDLPPASRAGDKNWLSAILLRDNSHLLILSR